MQLIDWRLQEGSAAGCRTPEDEEAEGLALVLELAVAMSLTENPLTIVDFPSHV